MCGIAGFLGVPASGTPASSVRAMTDAIAHRGPDADGAWCDEAAGIALGHRRLSIIDLSPAGAQPMSSASGRYVVAFNGEAYNYAPIRAELEQLGYRFRGHSDTEVLLAAFDRWGIRDSVPRFAGMFALAVWDRDTQSLWLIRDRLGEKPLYYGKVGGTWLFGSELKSLRAFPGFSAALNIPAITQFLRHGYIQAPASIYTGIAKVRPGTAIELRADAEPREHTYWSAEQAARAGLEDPLTGGMDEVVDRLDHLLRGVVADEMVADVPLGAFLSGGIDSSLIVAMMQAQATRPVRTFTIGFDDPRYNEAGFAQDVARHLATEHTELIVQGDDALQFVSRLHDIYDEPMADSSQLPTLLVAQMTRQHVTVALSGDGGDELFGGYPWYSQGENAKIRAVPRPLRAVVGTMLESGIADPPPDAVARALRSGEAPAARPANALTSLGAALRARGGEERYRTTLAHTVAPSRLLRRELRDLAGDGFLAGPWLSAATPADAMMLFDAVSYMPDDILVKVDRAAMAFSLETRAPFLDHRVFEFAWRVPQALKIQDGRGKQPLRHLLDRFVPRSLIDRPKRGFAVPLAAWLRGPLRAWADDLLTEASITATGVLDVAAVRRMWSQHTRGVADYGTRLWAVLVLLAFLRDHHASGAGSTARPA